jgi:hypothetical protein
MVNQSCTPVAISVLIRMSRAGIRFVATRRVLSPASRVSLPSARITHSSRAKNHS